jgi:hypothetical protein
MQIPSADGFSREPDSGAPARYWAAVPGAGFDLHVPEGAGFGPDAASLAFAEKVLPHLDAILNEAREHVRRYADAERLGIAHGRPELHGVFCDVARRRVEVGFSWEVQMHIFWTVAFHWDGAGRRTPVELSIRPR